MPHTTARFPLTWVAGSCISNFLPATDSLTVKPAVPMDIAGFTLLRTWRVRENPQRRFRDGFIGARRNHGDGPLSFNEFARRESVRRVPRRTGSPGSRHENRGFSEARLHHSLELHQTTPVVYDAGGGNNVTGSVAGAGRYEQRRGFLSEAPSVSVETEVV